MHACQSELRSTLGPLPKGRTATDKLAATMATLLPPTLQQHSACDVCCMYFVQLTVMPCCQQRACWWTCCRLWSLECQERLQQPSCPYCCDVSSFLSLFMAKIFEVKRCSSQFFHTHHYFNHQSNLITPHIRLGILYLLIATYITIFSARLTQLLPH